jgi:hypothetical protein
MKKVQILVALIFCFVSRSVMAFSCQLNGVDLPNGSTASITVPVGPEIVSGKNIIIDFSKYVSCAVTGVNYGYIDYIRTYAVNSNGSIVFENKLYGKDGGSTINGSSYNIPVAANIHIYTLDTYYKYVPLPIESYLNVGSEPDGVEIKAGDLLLTLGMKQTNNIDNTYNLYTWKVYAANDTYVSLSSCKINNNSTMDVDFGSLNSADIDQGVSHTIEKPVNYSCDNSVNHTVALKLIPATNGNDFTTTTEGLNVDIYRGSEKLKPNTFFYTDLNNGSGNDTLTFSLVKDKNYQDKVKDGAFSSNIILVMSNP